MKPTVQSLQKKPFFEACDILIKHFNIIFQGKGPEEKKELTGAGALEGESDITKIVVEDLKLTGRTLNALLNNGIKTVGGIMRKSEKSLAGLEGMGDKAISEIKRKLKKLGLELKSEE